MADVDYSEAIALLRANYGKGEITEEDLSKVLILVEPSANQEPVQIKSHEEIDLRLRLRLR